MRVWQVAVPYLKGRLDELYKRTSGHSTRSWLADLTASPPAQSADVNSTGLPLFSAHNHHNCYYLTRLIHPLSLSMCVVDYQHLQSPRSSRDGKCLWALSVGALFLVTPSSMLCIKVSFLLFLPTYIQC